jgi:hypothetical protein
VLQPPSDIANVAHVIQLAVAPVFLLTGVGAILSVLVSRLGRVVDRFRALRKGSEAERAVHAKEMATLSRRSHWIHWAISLCTLCALLICMVIAALFVSSTAGLDPSVAVSALFVAAMLALITGLICFLREIAIATGNLERSDDQSEPPADPTIR